MNKQIIGVTGPMCSGKGLVVNMLEKCGFSSISLSDMLRKELIQSNLEITRDNLQKIGNSIRKESGHGILSIKALEEIINRNLQKVVVDSIRNPAEIIELRKFKEKGYNILIVGITASIEKRFEFCKIRNRPDDKQNLEEFKKFANKDLGIGQRMNGQKAAACLKISDLIIENNETIDEFKNKIYTNLKDYLLI